MESLTLIIAYVIPLAFVVWLWLGKPGWRSKLLLTVCLPLFYWLHWQGLQDTKGWPAPQSLPEKFELIAADVFEPSQGKDGAIRLWVRETDDGEPRVYALPYSRKLHQALFDTKERVAQGRTQVGLLSDGGAGGAGAPVGNGQMLEFRDKPKSNLPPKY